MIQEGLIILAWIPAQEVHVLQVLIMAKQVIPALLDRNVVMVLHVQQ